jgi:hypothetical protein
MGILGAAVVIAYVALAVSFIAAVTIAEEVRMRRERKRRVLAIRMRHAFPCDFQSSPPN